MTNDAYWDDDPADPMPDHTYSSLPVTVQMHYRPDGSLDRDAMEAEAMSVFESDLDAWFAVRRLWWARRIARERQKPNPHPDTETIARNTEATDA